MNYIRYTDERGLFASTEAIGTDATTIENLANFGSINICQDWIKDWKKIRSEIKSIAITRTGNPDIPTWTTEQWNMFTGSEKVILCNFMPNKIPIVGCGILANEINYLIIFLIFMQVYYNEN